jgi:hypothetical protein
LVDINVTLSPSRKGGIDWSIGSTALASPLTGHLRLAAPVRPCRHAATAVLVVRPAMSYLLCQHQRRVIAFSAKGPDVTHSRNG